MRKHGGDRPLHGGKPRVVDDEIDAVEQADLREHFLRGRDVDEHHARIETGDTRRKNGGDAKAHRAIAREADEHRPDVQVVLARDPLRDDRTATIDDRRRVRAAARRRGERAGRRFLRSLPARQRAQQLDAEHAQDLAGERIARPRADHHGLFNRRRRVLHAVDRLYAQQRPFVEPPTDAEHLQIHVIRHDVHAGGERRHRGRVREIDRERNRDAETDREERDERA